MHAVACVLACRVDAAWRYLDLQPPPQPAHQGSDAEGSSSDGDWHPWLDQGPESLAVMTLLLVGDPETVWIPRQYKAWAAAYSELLLMLDLAFRTVRG